VTFRDFTSNNFIHYEIDLEPVGSAPAFRQAGINSPGFQPGVARETGNIVHGRLTIKEKIFLWTNRGKMIAIVLFQYSFI
jgi:hypothetical protein